MSLTPRDLVYIAGYSVVSGIIFALWSDVIAPIAFSLGGHVGIGAIYGMWFIGGTLVGYIVRRPAAAFLGETIGSIVELLLVSPYSILLYYYGPAQGIMSELAFALGKYSKWNYQVMALAGILPVVAAYPFDVFVSPFYPEARFYPIGLHITIVTAMVVSGALLAGVLVKLIVDFAVKAGAIKVGPSS